MAKIFYDHLIKVEEIVAELDKYEIDAVEKEEIISLADENLHIQTLDVILKKLPKEKHQEFLGKFHESPADEKLLEYLKVDIVDIEEQISDQAKQVKKEIFNEIKRSKGK